MSWVACQIPQDVLEVANPIDIALEHVLGIVDGSDI